MELQDEALFIRGFNSGYILEQHEPTLLTTVLRNISPSTDYVSGLTSGQRQYQLERRDQELNQLAALREKGSERDLDLDL